MLLALNTIGIDLELRLWINDPENGLSNIRSDINLAIWRAFKKYQITIPFPQRHVHVFTSNDNKTKEALINSSINESEHEK